MIRFFGLHTNRFSDSGRVRETKRFPEWNPQAGFTSAEENSWFRGIIADGTRLLLHLF